jgi:hypothetical protein
MFDTKIPNFEKYPYGESPIGEKSVLNRSPVEVSFW